MEQGDEKYMQELGFREISEAYPLGLISVPLIVNSTYPPSTVAPITRGNRSVDVTQVLVL